MHDDDDELGEYFKAALEAAAEAMPQLPFLKELMQSPRLAKSCHCLTLTYEGQAARELWFFDAAMGRQAGYSMLPVDYGPRFEAKVSEEWINADLWAQCMEWRGAVAAYLGYGREGRRTIN